MIMFSCSHQITLVIHATDMNVVSCYEMAVNESVHLLLRAGAQPNHPNIKINHLLMSSQLSVV